MQRPVDWQIANENDILKNYEGVVSFHNFEREKFEEILKQQLNKLYNEYSKQFKVY